MIRRAARGPTLPPVSEPAAERVGLFGGTFDPPHVGHVLVPTWVMSMHEVDRVLVCPCHTHVLEKRLSAFDQRVAWTRAAMAVHGARVEVSERLHARALHVRKLRRVLENVADRRSLERERVLEHVPERSHARLPHALVAVAQARHHFN